MLAGLFDALYITGKHTGIRLKLLAQTNWYSVLQMRAAHFDNMAKFLCFLFKYTLRIFYCVQ
ncbi:hypothetical protein D3C84_1035770 [compost metagenome]